MFLRTFRPLESRVLPRLTAIRSLAIGDSESNKTSIVLEMHKDSPGLLQKAISVFEKHNVNMTQINSRNQMFARQGPVFHIDFEGRPSDKKIESLINELRMACADVSVLQAHQVPWFPKHIRDLDHTKETLDGGTALINEDHPGFHDKAYRDRRDSIVRLAGQYSFGERIPKIDYTPEEIATWGTVYNKLRENHEKWACKEMLQAMPLLEQNCGFAPDNIPQLCDISDYLHSQTGFTLRPVSGLLCARDFLNALAFRVFFSTQYLRHHGNPLYTPEPDICHELLGHVPLFIDQDFADFSQEIGLASLGAPDEVIEKLTNLYWFTVEFGVLREAGQVKAYGAGVLSSFGEIEWACDENPSEECRESGGITKNYPWLQKPEILPFEPKNIVKATYPITTYQPKFFCADNGFVEVKDKMRKYFESLPRPFNPQYDPITQSIVVNRAIIRMDRSATLHAELQGQADKQASFFEDNAAKLNRQGSSQVEPTRRQLSTKDTIYY